MNIRKILVFEVLIFAYHGYCIDILSKFHQSDYKLRDLRIDVEYVNKTLLHDYHAIGHKYNRTTTAFNATFWPKIDLENKVECVAQVYKHTSNEYRLFPIRFQLNMCKSLQSNVLGMRKMANYGNYTLCNWKKNTKYCIRNFPIDETHLPPLIPSGEFKTQIELIYVKSHMATLNFYAEVYRPEV